MQIIFTALIILIAAVNGWTDAPSAIAGCVSSRSLSPKNAIFLAAVCNFSGAVIMALFRPGVARSLYGIADFGSDPKASLLSLCCALSAVILWATAAYFFGLPTSESHALISGMTGSALATNMSTRAINFSEWRSVILGLAISTLPVLVLAYLIYQLSRYAFKNQDRRTTLRYFKRVQFISAGSSAFLHGAQDSQKFIGVYLLGLSFLGKHTPDESFNIPIHITLFCAAAMTLGTMLGGSRIIKKVGCELTELDSLGSSAADTAASAFLGVCSFFGLPTATTHAKTCAIMGVGLSKKSKTNPRIITELFFGWLITFPVCAALGFVLSLAANAIFL